MARYLYALPWTLRFNPASMDGLFWFLDRVTNGVPFDPTPGNKGLPDPYTCQVKLRFNVIFRFVS